MKRLGLFALLSLGLLLIGCGIEPALSGKAYDDYQKSIKPYIAYWEKEGMTEEGRLRDSASCRAGGVTAGGIYKPDFDKARLPGETETAAYDRLLLKWEHCMLRAGYQYTGDCSSEYMKARPMCIAP